MDFVRKIDLVLFGDYSRSYRESIRVQNQRALLKESRATQEGIYWWIPVPSDSGLKWEVYAIHFSIYGETTHHETWKFVVDELERLWAKSFDENAELAYSGLPRGRVERHPRDQHKFVLFHGNDNPAPMSKVYAAFNFKPGRGREVRFDEHEQMQPGDVVDIQNALNFDLGLYKTAVAAMEGL